PRGGTVKRLLANFFIRSTLQCLYSWPVSLKWKAKTVMGLAYVAIRLFGWPATMAAWQRYHQKCSPRPGAPRSHAAAQAADEAIRDAAGRHIFNVECKERALGCWSLLREQGFSAKLLLGIDFFPFASHCWCELGPLVLTDYEDRCERFTPVLTYA